MSWHPVIINPKTGQRETNWLMSYSSEALALEYAAAWAEMMHAEFHDAVEELEDD